MTDPRPRARELKADIQRLDVKLDTYDLTLGRGGFVSDDDIDGATGNFMGRCLEARKLWRDTFGSWPTHGVGAVLDDLLAWEAQ